MFKNGSFVCVWACCLSEDTVVYSLTRAPSCREGAELVVFSPENVTTSIRDVCMIVSQSTSCPSFCEHLCNLFVCRSKAYALEAYLNFYLEHCNLQSHCRCVWIL